MNLRKIFVETEEGVIEHIGWACGQCGRHMVSRDLRHCEEVMAACCSTHCVECGQEGATRPWHAYVKETCEACKKARYAAGVQKRIEKATKISWADYAGVLAEVDGDRYFFDSEALICLAEDVLDEGTWDDLPRWMHATNPRTVADIDIVDDVIESIRSNLEADDCEILEEIDTKGLRAALQPWIDAQTAEVHYPDLGRVVDLQPFWDQLRASWEVGDE